MNIVAFVFMIILVNYGFQGKNFVIRLVGADRIDLPVHV